MNENLFKIFLKEMKKKFNKERNKHKDSWKTVNLYILRSSLKQHVKKWFNNYIDNIDNPIQEISDLIDISNYCMMIFNRLIKEK